MLKAIETRYAGCLFRSRIEARWACFWDSLGVVWEYEPEGFELPEGKYLPDFWLPELRFWQEIKGAFPTEREIAVACGLARESGVPVLIFHGAIEADAPGGFAHPDGRFYSRSYTWGQCVGCGRVDVIDREAWQKIHCPKCKSVTTYRLTSPALRKAYEAARSARFELGKPRLRKAS
jgi:hypothetical protein